MLSRVSSTHKQAKALTRILDYNDPNYATLNNVNDVFVK